MKGNKRQRNINIASWMALITVALAVYHIFSDGDFSFLMTLGSLCSAFGMTMLLIKTLASKSCAGISLKSLQLYTIVFFFRLLSIIWHEGYLPFDRSGDYVYQFVEFFSLCMCLTNIFLICGNYKETYNASNDAFGNLNIPSQFGAVYLAVPALIFALLIHPNLNGVWWSDCCWTFALYTEAVAVLPQLYMFQKAGGVVEAYTSHYVFSLGFARLLQLWFWLSSYHELSDKNSWSFVGIFVLVAQALQMLLMADFFYFYIKSVRKGTPMMLPTSINNV